MGDAIGIVILILLAVLALPIALLVQIFILRRELTELRGEIKEAVRKLTATKPVAKPAVEPVEKSIEKTAPTPAPAPVPTLTPTPPPAVPPPAKPPVAWNSAPAAVAPRLEATRAFKPLPEPPPRKPSELERRTGEILRKMWNWLVVGEEYRNPAVAREYALATTWLLRGAILLIVFGIGYFIKYSHENNLFPPELRLATAALVSVGMIVAGIRLINGVYRLFGITLVGGGFAGLYMVGFASVGIYKLLDPGIGLLLLIGLTAAGAILSLRLNNMLLAILAVTGGYAAPVLMSTGSRNLTGLFIYLLILSSGALLIGRYRAWRILNIIAFAGAWGLYAAAAPFRGDYPYVLAMTFGALFFALYACCGILFNVLNREKSSIIEILFTIANAGVFTWLTAPPTVREFGREYAAAITVALAVWFLLQLQLLLKLKLEDRTLLLTCLTLSSSFLALSIPLLLARDVLGAAWAIQALAMLFIGCRSNSGFLIKLGYAVFAIAGAYLFGYNFEHSYLWHDYAGWANRLVNFGTFSLSLGGAYFLLRKRGGDSVDSVSSQVMLYLLWGASLVFIFGEMSLLRRLGHQQIAHAGTLVAAALYLFFVACFFRRFGHRFLLAAATIGIAVLMILAVTTIRLDEGWGLLRAGQYLVAVLLLAAAARSFAGEAKPIRIIFATAAIAIWFVYSSAELRFQVGHWSPGGARAAVSILWGVYALAMLAAGVLRKIKPLRLAGLVLFAVTGLKVFLFDLAGAPTIYRVAGCLLIGAVMMAGAWFYTRFRGRFESEK